MWGEKCSNRTTKKGLVVSGRRREGERERGRERGREGGRAQRLCVSGSLSERRCLFYELGCVPILSVIHSSLAKLPFSQTVN